MKTSRTAWIVVLRILCIALLAAMASCDSSPSSSVSQATTPGGAATVSASDDGVDVSVTIDDAKVVLVASRDYSPAGAHHEGEATPAEPLSIVVPPVIPVTLGSSSGAKKAHLSYRGPTGGLVECMYSGRVTELQPTAAADIVKSRTFDLDHCSDGSVGGTVRKITYARLELLRAEHGPASSTKGEVNVTEIRLELGASFGTLPPAISPAESIALRDGFSWPATKPLAERDADGNPALYYANVYIEDREQLDFLDELLIHHDTLPIFSEEQAQWDGLRGTFDNDGDGTGVFLFAILPGVTYNQIRDAALHGSVIFRAMPLRAIPAGARTADGAISYQALRDAGFLYMNLDALVDPAVSLQSSATIRPFGLFSFLHKVVKAIASVVTAVVRGVQQAIGFIDRLVHGSVRVNVKLDLRNTDPSFGPGTPMIRTWGSAAGTQVPLPGVRVTLRQKSLSILPTMYVAHTGGDSVASMKVSQGKSATVCIQSSSPFAEMTTFLIATDICDFGSISSNVLKTNTNYNLVTQNATFNMLAQATEGGEYVLSTIGFQPRRVEILVGNLARLVGSQVVTPAFGFSNLAYDAAVAAAAAFLGRVGATIGPVGAVAGVTIAVLAGIIYAVDMIVGNDSVAKNSRGVISHEYGHFVLASLMNNVGPDNITIGYTGAIASRLTNLDKDLNPPPSHEGAYLNEAFADFMSEQTAGGKNYTEIGNTFLNDPMNYCDATAVCCVDENASDTSTFLGQVGRIFSLLHDAFDGSAHGPANTSGMNAWKIDSNTNTYVFAGTGGDVEDENVQLVAPELQGLLFAWRARSALLTEDSFLGGLADTVRSAGYDWCDSCRLFASHAGLTSAASMQGICESDPVRRWIGAKPAGLTCSFGCFDGKPCTSDTPAFSSSCGLSCPFAAEKAGVACRPSAGDCDVAEACDGASKECPADRFVASGTVCRVSSGAACDPAETCSGASATCPADVNCPAPTWTPFLDRDDPSGVGDFETLADFLLAGEACPNPLAIECRTVVGKVDFSATGEVYTCTPDVGGVCRNADQPDGSCEDYEVRFLCP